MHRSQSCRGSRLGDHRGPELSVPRIHVKPPGEKIKRFSAGLITEKYLPDGAKRHGVAMLPCSNMAILLPQTKSADKPNSRIAAFLASCTPCLMPGWFVGHGYGHHDKPSQFMSTASGSNTYGLRSFQYTCNLLRCAETPRYCDI